MSLQNQHVFSIDTLNNPDTGRPFGSRYAGEFRVRRPTVKDKEAIALRDAARISRFGAVQLHQVSRDVVNLSYIFSHLEVIGIDVPKWCDPSQLFDEDEIAVYVAWQEVSRWLATFRPVTDRQPGREGSDQPPVLVPADVQPSAD